MSEYIRAYDALPQSLPYAQAGKGGGVREIDARKPGDPRRP